MQLKSNHYKQRTDEDQMNNDTKRTLVTSAVQGVEHLAAPQAKGRRREMKFWKYCCAWIAVCLEKIAMFSNSATTF